MTNTLESVVSSPLPGCTGRLHFIASLAMDWDNGKWAEGSPTCHHRQQDLFAVSAWPHGSLTFLFPFLVHICSDKQWPPAQSLQPGTYLKCQFFTFQFLVSQSQTFPIKVHLFPLWSLTVPAPSQFQVGVTQFLSVLCLFHSAWLLTFRSFTVVDLKWNFQAYSVGVHWVY